MNYTNLMAVFLYMTLPTIHKKIAELGGCTILAVNNRYAAYATQSMLGECDFSTGLNAYTYDHTNL